MIGTLEATTATGCKVPRRESGEGWEIGTERRWLLRKEGPREGGRGSSRF